MQPSLAQQQDAEVSHSAVRFAVHGTYLDT
jgi:hypothetical protein